MPKTLTSSFATYTTMMRITKKGKPYSKDLYDMFSAILLQINLTDHRSLFRTYPSTFTTEDAVKVMSSLKFTHIHRQPDPSNPTVIISTKTTTSFSMDTNTAKNMLSYFLMARLIMNATDPTNWAMRDKGIWGLTTKGRYVLEEFAEYTQVNLNKSLISLPKGGRVVTLERLTDQEDRITFSRDNMTLAFKTMLSGLLLEPLNLDDVGGIERRHLNKYQHTFMAVHCVEWLTDCLTITSTEEAEMIASEFVLFGWISLVLDKSDKSLSKKDDEIMFQTCRNATYYVTERGYIAASWKLPKEETIQPTSDLSFQSEISASSKSVNGSGKSVSESIKSASSNSSKLMNANPKLVKPPKDVPEEPELLDEPPPDTLRPPSMSFTDSSLSHGSSTTSVKDSSNHTRLHHILETPLLRMYFREFLKSNYCTENILFWVDYDRLLRNHKQKAAVTEQLSYCYRIYETYIDTKATADVNIDYILRQEIIQYVKAVFVFTSTPPGKIPHFVVPESPVRQDRLLLLPPQASLKSRTFLIKGTPERCLIKLLNMFGRVNDHVCKMMAEDSVPKFIRTDRYKELISPKENKHAVEEDLLTVLQRASVEDQRYEVSS